MSYSVGQTVIHPHHGAAVVADVEERDFNGQRVQYLVMTAEASDLTLRVPAESVSSVGIRDCMDRDTLDQLLRLLQQEGSPPKGHWSQRLKRNQQRLRSGEPSEVAIVLRDLQAKDGDKGLSPAERRLRDSARLMLQGEVAAVVGGHPEAERLLDEALGIN